MGKISVLSSIFSVLAIISEASAAPKDSPKFDGVYVEALESYPKPRPWTITLGPGYYPFSAYYRGIALSGGVEYHFDNNNSWEVLNANYFFDFNTNLPAQIAAKAQLQANFSKLEYAVSTNGIYTHTHGKFVFLSDYIRYFKSSVIYGIGMLETSHISSAKTSHKISFAGDLGLRFTVGITEFFSWNFEVRDQFAVIDFDNFVTFNLTSGFSF